MNVKATIIITTVCLICLFVQVNSTESDKICYQVDVVPTHPFMLNYATASQFTLSESRYRDAKINYYLFDGTTGDMLVASNETTSHLCINNNDDDCYYLFIYGNGLFTVVNANNEDDETEDFVIKEGQVSYDEPSILQLGTCSRHYCDVNDQQITFVGLKDDEPVLYNGNNEIIHSLFNKLVGDDDDDDDDEIYKKEDDEEAVMKTACMQPKECYKLIGSSLYVLSATSTSNNNTTEQQEQGSTFHGPQSFGNVSNCRSHCEDNRPLLSSTQRGREILQIAASVSQSDALAYVQSSQYKAACWIIYDDARQVNADDYNILQRYILALMFYSLGGGEWNRGYDFMTHKHECQWRKWYGRFGSFAFGDDDGDGVHCDGLGYISGIILRANNMVGTVPLEVSSLVNIKYISLNANMVFGSIPSELGTLQQLRLIDFGQNVLTGSIPDSMGNIDTLEVVQLFENLLTGSIPSFFRGNNLHYFSMGSNVLSGTIPGQIGNWTNLRALVLQLNHLSGTIPEDIGNLPKLGYVNIFRNNLIGTLPSKIFKLPLLEVLDLNENSLTGTVPSQVAINSPLFMLRLYSNKLRGTIPSQLALLRNLRFFELNNNYFSGEIPSNFSDIQNIYTFNIHHNNLAGDVPFQDCEQSPRSMEADCNTPQKVSCSCCTACHGMFTSRYDYAEGLYCSSGELTVLVDNLIPGNQLVIALTNSEQHPTKPGKNLHDSFSVVTNSTSSFRSCISTSGCSRLGIHGGGVGDRPFRMNVWIGNIMVLDEYCTQLCIVDLGFHSDGNIRRDSCDDFILCNTTIKYNSTFRELVDKLTTFTSVQVLNDATSSHYNAACSWMNYLDGKDDDEDYKDMGLLQYFYLALLFYETNGHQWTNSDMWVTNANFCSWYGIECDSYGVVTSIRLPFNNLKGSLPTEIGELRGVEYIILDNNYISGTLPVEIGAKMTMLKAFDISHNGVWGSIPSEFRWLKELEELAASFNQLTGSLPEEIGNLNKLRVLNIFNNTCAGNLPGTFYDLYNLKHLSLGSNLFAGSAHRVQEFLQLESIDLSQNFFTGSVPLGSSQNKLRIIHLESNQFRGSIPASIEELKAAETLYLYDNHLTGYLPSEIGNLVHLMRVSFSNNDIKGVVPTEIGQLKNLTLLHLQKNRLAGTGDLFDYIVDDYISDCGNTFTGTARLQCTTCSSCCNVDGDCISREITWPGRTIPVAEISPRAFVFMTILAACLFVLMCVLGYQLLSNATSDFSFCNDFQAQSVYKFFLTNRVGALIVAAATLTIQLLVLSTFLIASDFTATKNDWEYSMSCPDDSIACEDNRLVSPMAWSAYSFVLLSYLANDFAESTKMMHQSMLLKSPCKGVLAGFFLLYVTTCSAVVSVLYNYSTGASNTDILKDAVILLFLNELDERLYSLLKRLIPIWVEDRNHEIEAHLSTLKRRYNIRRAAYVANTVGSPNEVEQQTPGSNFITNTDLVHNCEAVDAEEEEEMNLAGAEESDGAEFVTWMKNQVRAIAKLKTDFAHSEKAQAVSQINHGKLEQKYCDLEQEIRDFRSHMEREITEIKDII